MLRIVLSERIDRAQLQRLHRQDLFSSPELAALFDSVRVTSFAPAYQVSEGEVFTVSQRVAAMFDLSFAAATNEPEAAEALRGSGLVAEVLGGEPQATPTAAVPPAVPVAEAAAASTFESIGLEPNLEAGVPPEKDSMLAAEPGTVELPAIDVVAAPPAPEISPGTVSDGSSPPLFSPPPPPPGWTGPQAQLPTPTFEQRASSPAALEYAGFVQRTVALIIDWTILGAGGFVLLGLASAYAAAGLLFLFALPAPWLYYALMECSSRQGTLGKMAMDIIVVDLDGQRISFGRASGRFFARIVTHAIPLLIGYLLALFTQKKQTLHDIIASTTVVVRR